MNGQLTSATAAGGGSIVEGGSELFVTHIDHVGPYLKIYGQANRDAAFLVSTRIEQVLPTCFAIDPSWSLERQQALLTPSTLCVFKRTKGPAPGDVEYMRTRVVSATPDQQSDKISKMSVKIEFLEYGYKKTVDSHDLMFSKQPKLLQNIPLLCSQFIVLGICSDWEKADDLATVRQLIVNQTVHIKLFPQQICDQKFASVMWNDFYFDEFLVEQKQIGARVSNELMMDHCKKMWKDLGPLQSPPMEFNNNNIHLKTPTDMAREQLAARRSLAARLEQQRAGPVTPPRHLNVDAPDYIPKQQTPLANVTNVMPPMQTLQKLVGIPTTGVVYPHQNRANQQQQQVEVAASLPYVPKTNPSPRSVYNLYNVRLNKPIEQPLPLMHPLKTSQPLLHYTPARFTPPLPATMPHQLQPKQVQQPPPTQQRVIPAFRTTSLTVGLTYDVIVSFVENGPHLFWVQLKSSAAELTKMMGEIERMHLQPLSQMPQVGTACVARFTEDGHCYRALVSATHSQRFRVVYVDYGNSEMVALNDLFQIPQELLGIKPFAFRFALAGTKVLEPIDESMKHIFRSFALYGAFQLTVEAPESVGAMQTCQLHQNKINVLEVLKKLKNSRQSYAKAEQLQTDDAVEIRYIDSPNNFYVQKVGNIKEFEKLMDEMFAYYNTNQVVPEQLLLGAPCIVKCDQEWYRAEILRVAEPTIIVKHVDFGYEQKVKRHLIGKIAEKHLKMPRQAVKCCLKGFENSELCLEKITDQFEMLAEESNIRRRTFSVRVFRIEPDGVNVVNLLAKNLNVMKKLYKLSMPFEQYLSLEKGQFNCIRSEPETEKGHILNSTTVESEDRMQLQRQQQLIQQKQQQELQNQQQQQQNQQRAKNSNDNWEKRSSTSNSSRDNKVKEEKQRPVQQKLDSSFETQSTSSCTSGATSPRKANRRNGRLQGQSPQMQNGQKEASNKHTRFSLNQSPRKDQQQQQQQPRQQQRSQNAPQGFAQKPQRQKSTLDGNIKRSSGVDSDATSSESSVNKPEKYVPLDKEYTLKELKTPSKDIASLSWWVSPFQFYVVCKSLANKYENLLQREMKEFYRQKPHRTLQLKVGSTVVVRQRKEHNILRATIVACNHMTRRYRVFCVDTGCLMTVTSEDVWQLEQRFAEPPCLAHRCSFHTVLSNYDHLYIVDRMDKFVPVNAKVECEFLSKQNNVQSNANQSSFYIVNMLVNGASLRDLLVKAEFLTEVAPEIRVSLLAGQQVRGKFTSIRDMSNFKIQLDFYKDVNFLCTYDDAKFVKSNPDLAKRFKEFYQGKSCAFNVKSVCENNIIHLRPVMPLFKEDRGAFVCGYPVVVNNFKARVVYCAKPYRVFVQPMSEESSMKKLLDDMFEFYNSNGKPLKKFEPGQICAAHSDDNNWYRARIVCKDANGSQFEVFYIDYGNTEKLSKNNIKVLDDEFYVKASGFGIEINLPFGKYNNENKLMSRVAEFLEEQVVTVKPIEIRRFHLVADLLLKNNQSIVDVLKGERLISGRDLDYMRKLLDKDRPFTYEYIEMVDLTEDDDDNEKVKEKNKPLTKEHSSPKGKKAPPQIVNEISETITDIPKTGKRTVKSPVPQIEKEVSEKSTDIPQAVKPVEKPAPIAVPEPVAVASIEPEPKAPTGTAVAPIMPPARPQEDRYKGMETAVLSHCDNPAHFYVHSFNDLDALQRLQENLQIVSRSLPPLKNVVNGGECISLYSVDKCWYRARIIDAELMVLQFIDFGNTDCVSDTTDVRMSMCKHISPFCHPLALPICPKGTSDWVDAANGIFNDSYSKILRYKYLTHGDDRNPSYVELYIDDVDVAKKLIADGFAKPLEYIESGCSCYISHVNGIREFYIQLERDSKALELIEMYLRDAEHQLKPLERFEKGSIVAAMFAEDELWYRAELLRQLNDSQYEVLFIDYGNTSITSKCLILSEEVANLPKMSKKCSLQLPESYTKWSKEAEAKFIELTGEGELVFTTQLLKPAKDHVVINLLLDEENIIDQLLSLCEKKEIEPTEILDENPLRKKAIITHVDNAYCLYLQLQENEALVDSISKKLNSDKLDLMEPNKREVGQLCAVQFDENQEFYRSKILELLPNQSNYRVIFIDYGNECIADELYELPSDLIQIEPLAEIYALEASPIFEKNKTMTCKGLDTLLDTCNGEVNMEIVDKTSIPPVINVHIKETDGLNLSGQLKMLLESEFKLIEAKTNDNKECIISHGSSPKSFYVQLKKNSSDLDNVVKVLKNINGDDLKILNEPTPKLMCVVYSQEDNCHYRACIKSIMEEGKDFEVFLIDYGNTIHVQQVYQMGDDILDVVPLALHCKLSKIPEGVPDSELDEAFSALLEQHFGEVYELITDLDGGAHSQIHSVELLINYKNFAQELANTVAGVQKPLEVELHNCIVVQYDDPTSFYVQMEKDVPALEQLTDKLLDAENDLPVFTELKVGALCVAQFHEDEVFYRAEIIKVLDDEGKCEVHFIDFGNNAVTQQFRQLPENLAQMPRFSKHCELESATIAKCNVSDLQTFIDTRFSETFQVEILAIKDGDTHVVRLYYQSTSISEKLRQQDK